MSIDEEDCEIATRFATLFFYGDGERRKGNLVGKGGGCVCVCVFYFCFFLFCFFMGGVLLGGRGVMEREFTVERGNFGEGLERRERREAKRSEYINISGDVQSCSRKAFPKIEMDAIVFQEIPFSNIFAHSA